MAADELNDEKENGRASAGHKLGQLVGDWFAEYIVYPLLSGVAERLRLYLDSAYRTRTARGDKLLWQDAEGNSVDYDFVMELGGTDEAMGIPIAFFECFWRRGSRHSKDKARDDSGKLLPMRHVYPTARFLGIIAAGDLTGPARQLVTSRQIDLFYAPKDKVLQAFANLGLQADYPDKAAEPVKQKLAQDFERKFTDTVKHGVAEQLRDLLGAPTIATYIDRVRAAMGALPQEFRFIARRDSAARVFSKISAATAFLEHPDFDFSNPAESYVYQITYSDGTEFEREVAMLEDLKELHRNTDRLAQHMGALAKPAP
jgi:hypothetical protein